METTRSVKVGSTTFKFTIQTGTAIPSLGNPTLETQILILENGWLVGCKSKPFLGTEGRLTAERWLNSLTEEQLKEKAQIVADNLAMNKTAEPDEIFKHDELEQVSQ